MRTRNADAPKSGAAKKTPPEKKDATSAADKTPSPAAKPAKPAPKPSLAAKPAKPAAASKQPPTPKSSPPDPKPTAKADEPLPPSEEKKPDTAAVKSPVKKPAAKGKSPAIVKAAAARKVQETPLAEAPASLVEESPAQESQAEEKPKPEPEPQPELEAEPEPEEPGPELEAEPDPEPELAMEPEEPELEPEEPEPELELEDSYPVNMEEDLAEKGEALEEAGGELGEGEEGGGEEAVEAEEGREEEGCGLAEDEQMEISDMAKQQKIRKEQEIFVGGLDRDATEEDLRRTFEKIGDVVEVRLHRDFATNKNKGFAFVKFDNKEQASRALVEMRNPIIRGKRCGIAPSEDNDTLFLGNICNTWTREAIKRKLKDYGVDGVGNITLVGDTQSEGLSRGFAFVEFSCHADAMLAYKRLQRPDVIFGHPERTAKVAFAEPLREPDAEVMAQVKAVFVDGLPPYWDEDRVKEQFKGYGEIERVVLARNMPSAKRKDFGFVNFTTHDSAVACIEGVNNTELGDGKLKMKARARLANPLPKTQAVKGGMRGGFRTGHTGIGSYSRFGRGYGRGGYFSHRAPFQGGRGFHQRGRGRGGRFSFAADGMEGSYSEFRGRRPFGIRGGRRGSFRGAFQGTIDEFGGHGNAFSSRRQPFPTEGEYGRPFAPRYFGDDPYLYNESGHGIKRPFSMMEHDPAFLDAGPRLRPRYEHPDPLPIGARYRDSLGMGGLYPHDYYGSEFGSSYSSLYGGEHSGDGYYY